jgi:hypothetical protein
MALHHTVLIPSSARLPRSRAATSLGLHCRLESYSAGNRWHDYARPARHSISYSWASHSLFGIRLGPSSLDESAKAVSESRPHHRRGCCQSYRMVEAEFREDLTDRTSTPIGTYQQKGCSRVWNLSGCQLPSLPTSSAVSAMAAFL